MSIVKHFKNITETKILLIEVSKGKRNALLKKIAKEFHKDRGEDTLYKQVVHIIDNYPMMVERIYGQFEKFNIENPINRKKVLDKYFHDQLQEIFAKYGNPKDQASQYAYEKWWGVVSLMGCIKLFKDLEAVDPTKNMKYGNWLVDVVLDYAINKGMFGNRLSKNNPNNNFFVLQRERGTFYEDLPKLDTYLDYYDEAKKKNELPEDLRDINSLIEDFNKKYPDAGIKDPFHILNHVTKQFRTIQQKDVYQAIETHLEKEKDYTVTENIEEFDIFQPLTQKANSIIGMGTEWCTTYGEYCTNPDYQDRSPIEYDDLWILVDRSDPKIRYQFHFQTDQYMDIDDAPIDMVYFFNHHRKIFKFFIENDDDLSLPYTFDKDKEIVFEGDDAFIKSKYGTLNMMTTFVDPYELEDLRKTFLNNLDKRNSMKKSFLKFLEGAEIRNDDKHDQPTLVEIGWEFLVKWTLHYNKIISGDQFQTEELEWDWDR